MPVISDFGVNAAAETYPNTMPREVPSAVVWAVRDAIRQHHIREGITVQSAFCDVCSVVYKATEPAECVTLAAALMMGWTWPTRDDLISPEVKARIAAMMEDTRD